MVVWPEGPGQGSGSGSWPEKKKEDFKKKGTKHYANSLLCKITYGFIFKTKLEIVNVEKLVNSL